MVSETWESFVKLPHEATLTMEQVRSECHVHTSFSVGWYLPEALSLLGLCICRGTLYYQMPRLVSKSGSDGVGDLGKNYLKVSLMNIY